MHFVSFLYWVVLISSCKIEIPLHYHESLKYSHLTNWPVTDKCKWCILPNEDQAIFQGYFIYQNSLIYIIFIKTLIFLLKYFVNITNHHTESKSVRCFQSWHKTHLFCPITKQYYLRSLYKIGSVEERIKLKVLLLILKFLTIPGKVSVHLEINSGLIPIYINLYKSYLLKFLE